MKLSDAVRGIANGDPYWASAHRRVNARSLLRQVATEHDSLTTENEQLRKSLIESEARTLDLTEGMLKLVSEVSQSGGG